MITDKDLELMARYCTINDLKEFILIKNEETLSLIKRVSIDAITLDWSNQGERHNPKEGQIYGFLLNGIIFRIIDLSEYCTDKPKE